MSIMGSSDGGNIGNIASFGVTQTLNQLMDIIAEVGVAEIGHEVGLVSEELGGTGQGHYTSNMPQHIMNDGLLTPLMWFLGIPATRQFSNLDIEYLKFTFPTGGLP